MNRIVVSLLAFLLAVTACSADTEGAQGDVMEAAPDDAPDWVERMYPLPDTEMSTEQAVQIRHNAMEKDRQVRLLVDGVDVTSYAVGQGPGLLVYDVEEETVPVPLDPGTHTAEVVLMRVTPGASEGVESFDPEVHEALDSYRWSFTVL